MKLKKLMKHIKDDTYIKIGANGYCCCACKKKDAKDIIESYNDYYVSSINAGRLLENIDDTEYKYTVDIFVAKFKNE